VWDSYERGIGPSQKMPDNTQHSQEKDIHAPGDIGTRSLSKRVTTGPPLRPRGHRWLASTALQTNKKTSYCSVLITKILMTVLEIFNLTLLLPQYKYSHNNDSWKKYLSLLTTNSSS